jgi:hypothetical protein
MKKGYEKPRILETMPIEHVLMGEMGEGIAPEWINWQQSWHNWNNWNNSWQNTGAVLPPEEGPAVPPEEGGPSEPAV